MTGNTDPPIDKTEGPGGRLLLLVEVVAGFDGEFTLKELTARAELPTTTVHRLLQVLLGAQIVERAGSQTYRPGPRLLRLAGMVLKDLDAASAARPFLRRLWTDWQETAVFALYKPRTRSATVVEVIAAPHPLRFVMEQYLELALTWGSFGRAILAHLPPQELDAAVAARTRSALTGREPPSAETLLEQVAAVRREGVATFVDQEHDLAGVAAPVFGPQRSVIGSLGLAMPASRFAGYDGGSIRRAVSACAQGLSEAVGWTPMPGRSAT